MNKRIQGWLTTVVIACSIAVPELAAQTVESVQADYLQPAIQELWAVVRTSDVALRRELERRRRRT